MSPSAALKRLRANAMRLLKVLLILFVCATAIPAVAGPLENAHTAWMRGEYETALRIIRPLADQGDTAAQTELGFWYWSGMGVPQDYVAAERWTRKAAENGDAKAQANLGSLYLEGQGVPRDYTAALMWMRKSAEQGHPFGQGGLGDMYEKGQGVPKDYVQAYKWYNLAAASEPSGSRSQDRENLAKKMTLAQIAEAQKLASRVEARVAAAMVEILVGVEIAGSLICVADSAPRPPAPGTTHGGRFRKQAFASTPRGGVSKGTASKKL